MISYARLKESASNEGLFAFKWSCVIFHIVDWIVSQFSGPLPGMNLKGWLYVHATIEKQEEATKSLYKYKIQCLIQEG